MYFIKKEKRKERESLQFLWKFQLYAMCLSSSTASICFKNFERPTDIAEQVMKA
jgi:hypothetical protein